MKEIHIVTTDNKTTYAILKEDGEIIKKEKAICPNEDYFDFEIEANLAFKRLMEESTLGRRVIIKNIPTVGYHFLTCKKEYLGQTGKLFKAFNCGLDGDEDVRYTILFDKKYMNAIDEENEHILFKPEDFDFI